MAYLVFTCLFILTVLVTGCYFATRAQVRAEESSDRETVRRYNELPPLPTDWRCVHCGGAQRFTFCKALGWPCGVFRGSDALENVVAPHLHGKCERCGAAGAVSRSLDWKRLETDGKGAVSIAEAADHAGALTRASAEEATEQINRDLDLLGKR